MFQVNYCGYNTYSGDSFVIKRPQGSQDYLFLLFLAPMKVYFPDGRNLITRPYACMIYPPGCFQHYHAVNRFYNSYMHFSSDSDLIEEYALPQGVPFYPGNFQDLNGILKDIFEESILKHPFYEKRIHALITSLLILCSRDQNPLCTSSSPVSPLHRSFDEARIKILQDLAHDWTADEMAALVSLGKSQFFSLYRSFYNCTPRADLLSARLDKAKELLINDQLSVAQTAEACGFKNIYHFSRYFTKKCGCPPSRYGKMPPKAT